MVDGRIDSALMEAIRTFDHPATTTEIEARMSLGLSNDKGVAIDRCRIALCFRALIEGDVERLPDDRWQLVVG